MKTNRLSWAALLFLIILLTAFACVTEPSVSEKRQAEAIRDLGREYLVHGKVSQALKELKKAEAMNPNDFLNHDYLGLAYHKKKRYNLAIKHYKKSIELNPDYGPAKNNLGITYLEMKDWDTAIACFKNLIEESRFDLYLTPHFPQLNLAFAYYSKGEYRLAENHYKEALQYYVDGFKKDVHYLQTLIGLGRTYLKLKQYPQAVEMLETAVNTAPTLPHVHFELAKAYQAADYDESKVLNAYKKVISLDPKSIRAQEAQKEIIKILGDQ